MADSITEWEFTADVAKWISGILSVNPGLPFSEAKCEQRGQGSLKRRDLSLLNKNKVVVLTGEIKLPFSKDGGSPYIETVIQDARKKAQQAGVEFFFTWNVNEFVLWETFPAKTTRTDRKYKSWEVTVVHKPEHLEISSTIHAIKKWLELFLNSFDKILRGTYDIGTKTPDEKFIEALESALKVPILNTLDELQKRYQKPKSKSELDKWMRDEQGWIIYDDPEGVRDNLERAAKFSCYALVNKLVFYEALLKRYREKMDKLIIPDHIDTGDDLRLQLETFFAEAKDVTSDYETVFGEDHIQIGNRIPFYSDSVVPHWRSLINQIHDFDFSKLDYEVIGAIFERLISPEERHRYGQFYTRPEVVDLINSFCIRKGNEKIMDPACGGGTFLVRAYARKRELDPRREHGQLLRDLFGIDVSHFATHLTTINLATRDLIDEENYPQIARSDFFDIVPLKAFITLPTRIKTKGMGEAQHREVEIPLLDAVVTNPPYLRQEGIPKAKDKSKPDPGTKEFYQLLVSEETNIDLNARSDIHCYFWPHASTFLKDDGYLCFLTSSQWLDVEYGFRLQEWMLKNFEVAAVFESFDEPWFVGARVATAVTILRRQRDEAERMKNYVRFAQLRRPIREILAHDGTTAGAINAADEFRDEILSLTFNTVNERYQARVVKQGDIWQQGVRLGVVMGQSKDPGSNDPSIQDGDYLGCKWGVYLRAPDLWFRMLDDYGPRFKPLGEIAEIRFGVKSGKDSFFYPIDISSDCLRKTKDPSEFEINYGAPRGLVESGEVKLVRCGEGRGEVKPIEAKYLEPEVHSLMEIDGFTVKPEDCSRQILLVGEKKSNIKDKYVLEYIQWGESKGYHEGSTCAGRVTDEKEWYDLTGHKRGVLFWPKAQQYKHIIPLNEKKIQCNCNLYDVYLQKDIDVSLMAGVLNSTLVVLLKFQYGRPVGVEGNLKTEIIDANMMLVPDPTRGIQKAKRRVAKAFEAMKARKALFFISERRLREMSYLQQKKEPELDKLSDICELDMEDRRELDDAVLELLGVKPKKRRQELIKELYGYLREFFEWTRQKEEKAILNKKKNKWRTHLRHNEIASYILEEMKEHHPKFLRRYERAFLDRSKPYVVVEIPTEGSPQKHEFLNQSQGVDFYKGKKFIAAIEPKIPEQSELIILLAETGVRGLVRIPYEQEECKRVTNEYYDFIYKRETLVRELIQKRTADEEMQGKIHNALMLRLVNEK